MIYCKGTVYGIGRFYCKKDFPTKVMLFVKIIVLQVANYILCKRGLIINNRIRCCNLYV